MVKTRQHKKNLRASNKVMVKW